jgi:hypothetical protein
VVDGKLPTAAERSKVTTDCIIRGLRHIASNSYLSFMNMLKAIGKLLLIYVASFVAVDIAGALLVTILPSPGGRRMGGGPGFGSLLLYYVVWIVAGCFMGLFYTEGGREKTTNSIHIQRHPLIVPAAALIFSILSIILFYALGQMSVYRYANSDFYYVPDNRYMTYAFFISMLATSLFLTRHARPVASIAGDGKIAGSGIQKVKGRTAGKKRRKVPKDVKDAENTD